MNPTVPAWLLERYALGELPPARMEEVRRLLEAEPDGLARLAALRADDAAVLAAYPPAEVADAVLRRASQGSRPANNRAWYAVAPVIAVAAAAALYVNAGTAPTEPVSPDVEITRTKGLDPQLVVLRKRAGDPERLEDGDAARAGDVLQLRYVAGGDRYGAVVSVDGRGSATVHLAEGGHAVRLDPDGAIALPSAFELDDAPAFERFFLVSGDRPFDVASIVSAAEAAGGAPGLAFPDLHVTAFTVRKP